MKKLHSKLLILIKTFKTSFRVIWVHCGCETDIYTVGLCMIVVPYAPPPLAVLISYFLFKNLNWLFTLFQLLPTNYFILLTLLFPYLPWMFFRYQRGSRSLAANLSMSQSTTVPAAVTQTQEQEEEYDIPEELETVIGELQPLLTLKMCYFSTSA